MTATIHPLRRWLQKNKERQSVFAERSGIAPGRLSRYLGYQQQPTLDVASRMVRATKGALRLEDFVRPEGG